MEAGLHTEAIRAIYDAALSEDRWQKALDGLVDATAARCGMLYDMNVLHPPAYSLTRSSRYFHDLGDAVDRYNRMIREGRGSGYDDEGLRAMQSHPSFKAVLDEELFDMNPEYPNRPEVVWCREKIGFYRRFVVSLSQDPNERVGLIFQYANSFASVPADDPPLIEAFAPHVAKAIEMHRLVQPLRAKYRAVLGVLDMIDLPIVLFERNGTAILKNRAAGDVLSARDALWLDAAGRLRARQGRVGGALGHAVGRMARTARGEGLDRSVEIEIARGPGSPPLYAIVSPLRDADMELEAGLDGALMTLIDPAYPVRARVDLVASAYGLTPAEARVAGHLSTGLSNADIAEVTGVGAETVKSQVAAIFDKTGCRGRMAFLWRVFQFSPPVR